MTGPELVEGITAYGGKAKRGEIACALAGCPCCRGRPVRFQRHGVRKRLFLVFADWVIQRVWSYLTRWKCPLCRQTFTLYPDFALPFKRYVLAFIVERCAAYAEDAARTYREGIQAEGVAISYEDADAGMALWPSTLWRWVGTLGGFPKTVRQALHLIKQKDPSTGVFRALGGLRIRKGKYRSEERKAVLQRCRAWGVAERAYVPLFHAALFPDLAIRCGFT